MRGVFDEGFNDSAPDREIVPDGVHQCMIRYAKDDAAKGKTTIGFAPHGQYGLVFVNIADDEKGRKRAAALAAALGLTAAEWADMKPDELLKKRLRIETRQWLTDDGQTVVNIDAFMPFLDDVDPAAKPSATPARTPAAKVAAARGEEPGGGDDIPF